jgi:hypothetical protein
MRLKPEEIKKLSKIPREKVKYLWYSDYWDGIKSGMLLYNNQKYWFVLFDDATDYVKYDEDNKYEDIGWWKRYAIIKLSENQYEKAQYWHDLFYKYVAVYCTYDENEKLLGQDFPQEIGKDGIKYHLGARPIELHHIFFDEVKKEYPDSKTNYGFDDGEIIGWFEIV